MVGHGDAVHIEFGGAFDDAIDGGIPVEQAVFGVHVQVDKIVHGCTIVLSRCGDAEGLISIAEKVVGVKSF